MAHICECLATLMILLARIMRYINMFMVCDFDRESNLSGRIKYQDGDTVY